MIKTKEFSKVIEISITIPFENSGQIEILRGLLVRQGVKLHQIVETRAHGMVRLSVYVTKVTQVSDMAQKIKELPLKKSRLKIGILEAQDWRDKWKEGIGPFNLTKKIQIIPVWGAKTKKNFANKRMKIYLDTINAFGTGLHETTKFMAQLIEQCQGSYESFLDIGTGTGILSMVAYKLGVRDIYALDHDPNCLKVARKNFLRNGIKHVHLTRSDIINYKPKQKFDFVAANLVTHDLIKTKKKICSLVKAGQFLAISGISLDNFKKIKEHYTPLPLSCQTILKGRKWAAILYKKNG